MSGSAPADHKGIRGGGEIKGRDGDQGLGRHSGEEFGDAGGEGGGGRRHRPRFRQEFRLSDFPRRLFGGLTEGRDFLTYMWH